MAVNLPVALCVLLATVVIWPIVGIFVVQVAVMLRVWAHCGEEITPVHRQQKLIFSAGWPVVLIFALVVYPCLGILNRTLLTVDRFTGKRTVHHR